MRGRVLDDLLRHLLSGRKSGRPDRAARRRKRERGESQRESGAGDKRCHELSHILLLASVSQSAFCAHAPTLTIGQLSLTEVERSLSPPFFSSWLICVSLLIKTGFALAFQVRIVSFHTGE